MITTGPIRPIPNVCDFNNTSFRNYQLLEDSGTGFHSSSNISENSEIRLEGNFLPQVPEPPYRYLPEGILSSYAYSGVHCSRIARIPSL